MVVDTAMVFMVSFVLWITFFGRVTFGSVFFGILVSVIAQFVSLRIVPHGPSVRTAIRIALSLPVAVIQAFRLLFSRALFTARSEKSPQNLVEEFGKIVSITMTPEQVVISKEDDHVVVHEVKR